RGRGLRVAQGDVAALVLGYRAHPAVGRVRRVRALLVHGRRRAARHTEFVPAHADAGAGGDRVVGHQGLVVAVVAVGQPVHDAVGQRVQLLAGAALRDAGP